MESEYRIGNDDNRDGYGGACDWNMIRNDEVVPTAKNQVNGNKYLFKIC